LTKKKMKLPHLHLLMKNSVKGNVILFC